MFKRILVATDGSALSGQALAKGIDLALLTGAELLALNVAHLAPHSLFEGSTVLSQRESDDLQHRTDAAAHAVADAAKAAAQSKGVASVQAIVVKSNQVAEAIVETAKSHDCDLIVMASHGRHGISAIVLGSETVKVLTHSTIPVLVYR